MHFILIIVILGIFAFIVLSNEPSTSANKPVIFQTLSKDVLYNNVERGNYIISKSAELRDIWNKAYSSSSPIPDIPQIDFSKEIVIAVFNGPEYTGGYGIEITNIVETEENFIIYVNEVSPSDNCAVTQQLTSPFHIIKIPRTEKDIGFTIIQEAAEC